MKLKALKKCWDDQKGIAVQVGEEFEVPEDKAKSFIRLGAAIALPSNPVPAQNTEELIEEEAIAPAPKEDETPKPTKKSRT